MASGLLRYLTRLTTARIILWCYAIWYAGNVLQHFDPSPRLWLNSLGISGIIGIALVLSVRGAAKPDGWQVFRLFLMPFCVSSFAALVKDAGYFLIFPPSLHENLTLLGVIAAFLAGLFLLRKFTVPSSGRHS